MALWTVAVKQKIKKNNKACKEDDEYSPVALQYSVVYQWLHTSVAYPFFIKKPDRHIAFIFCRASGESFYDL